jgi:hypothetical protein
MPLLPFSNPVGGIPCESWNPDVRKGGSVSESEHADLTWRKSSASGEAGGCVEIAMTPTSVHVRNSRHSRGPELEFLHQEWAAFLVGARNGEFELPTSPEGDG